MSDLEFMQMEINHILCHVCKIWHSRVPNLTWTHYRELLTVSDEAARHWYMQEAAK